MWRANSYTAFEHSRNESGLTKWGERGGEIATAALEAWAQGMRFQSFPFLSALQDTATLDYKMAKEGYDWTQQNPNRQ